MKKVGIIAPSGSVENFDEYKIKTFFETHKIELKIFPSCYKKFRYLAGDDALRLDDIHNCFLDKTIDTIICARGGYGAIRLLDDIDYNLIKENKKTFVGFSDITALLIAFYKNSNLKSFHGKMAVNGVINMNDEEFRKYCELISKPFYNSNLKGGILWGGNLTTICSLFGSSEETYLPYEDIILFIEDVNEPDYKLDRMFCEILRNKPLREKIKGVIFGEFSGAGKFLQEIQEEFIKKLNVPFEVNLNIGHNERNQIVPFGYLL